MHADSLGPYQNLVQTVKSLKGLSGKICPREVQRVIRLITRGTSHGQIFQTILRTFH